MLIKYSNIADLYGTMGRQKKLKQIPEPSNCVRYNIFGEKQNLRSKYLTKFYRTDAASAQLGQNQENKQDLQSPISNKPIENSLFSVIFVLLPELN